MSAVIKTCCPDCGLNMTIEETTNGIVILVGGTAITTCPNCKRPINSEDFGYVPSKKMEPS